MRKKSVGTILLIIIIIYYFILSTLSEHIPSNLNSLFWGIWIVLTIFYVYWLAKNTNFFKKQNNLKETVEHRKDVLEEMGFFSIMISIWLIISIILTGMGAYILLLSDLPGKSFSFWLIALGLAGIFGAIFMNRKIKKKE